MKVTFDLESHQDLREMKDIVDKNYIPSSTPRYKATRYDQPQESHYINDNHFDQSSLDNLEENMPVESGFVQDQSRFHKQNHKEQDSLQQNTITSDKINEIATKITSSLQGMNNYHIYKYTGEPGFKNFFSGAILYDILYLNDKFNGNLDKISSFMSNRNHRFPADRIKKIINGKYTEIEYLGKEDIKLGQLLFSDTLVEITTDEEKPKSIYMNSELWNTVRFEAAQLNKISSGFTSRTDLDLKFRSQLWRKAHVLIQDNELVHQILRKDVLVHQYQIQ